jgi:hypothetical protein
MYFAAFDACVLIAPAAVGLYLRTSDIKTAFSRGGRGTWPCFFFNHFSPSEVFMCLSHRSHRCQIWESFTRVLDSVSRPPPESASHNGASASASARTQQQRALLGERGGVGSFSTEFVDPATPRGMRWSGGLSGSSDIRDSSPVAVGGGSSSSMVGMQPAYLLMQVGGDGAALSERRGGEEEGQIHELDLSRKNLRSGSSSGGGMAFTRVMREFRC